MRKEILRNIRDSALRTIAAHTEDEIKRKGNRSFSSTHEILGCMTEEYFELINAVKSNNHEEILEELKDIATVCHFAIACMKAKTLDW